MVKILHKIINVIIIIFLSLFFLLLLLQIPTVQNFIAKKVIVKLKKEFDIPLDAKQVQVLFFNTVKIKNIELDTKENDTLFYADEIKASIRLRDLLKDRVYIKRFKLEGANFNLIKKADSTLNITPIIESFQGEEKVPKENKKPFEIFLNRMILDDINFLFKDNVNQSSIGLFLGGLNVKLQALDIKNKNIGLQTVELEDVVFSSTTSKPTIDTSSTKPIDLNITINKGIKTKNVELAIVNQFTKQNIRVNYDKLNVSPEKINLREQSIDVNSINLKGAQINFEQEILTPGDSLELAQFKTNNVSTRLLWNVKTNTVEIDKTNFIFADANKTSSSQFFKEGKIILNDINTEIENILIGAQNYAAEITSFDLMLNNELPIKNLNAKVTMDSVSAAFNDVLLETDQSKIELNGKLKFTDADELIQGMIIDMLISANAGNQDLAYFLPAISTIQHYPDVIIDLKTEGKLSDLNINSLSIKADEAIDINLNGNLKNLTQPNKIYGNLDIKRLVVHRQETEQFISDTLLPKGILIPDTLQLTGNIAGNTSKIKSEFEFVSTIGRIDAIVDFKNDTLRGNENVVASLNIKNLNAGKLLNKQDTLGLLSLQGDIESNSTDFKNAELIFDLNVSRIGLLKYDYKNITLKGNYKDKYFNGESTINDRNVALAFDGKINLKDSIPEFNIDLNIDSANLGNLNVVPENMKIAGHIIADIKGKEWNQLKGELSATDAQYSTEKDKYTLQKLDVDFNQYGDSSRYILALASLFSNDSILLNNANIDATLFGKKGNLDYAVYLSDTTSSQTNQWVKGDGSFAFTEDTIVFKTNAKINHHKEQPPLDFAFDFKRFQVSQGHQDIQLIVDGTHSYMVANAEMINNGEETEIDATVQIDSLNLGLAEPFLMNQFNTFTGSLNGNVSITGNMNKPIIAGEININKTEVNPKIINTPVHIDKQNLVFKKDRLTLNKFELTDNQKNSAFVSGYVDVADIKNIRFNLSLLANKFKLLNKPASAGGSFYGNVTADVNADIKGTATSPVISLNAAFKYDSEFYYVAPESNSGAEKQEGVIVFVNKNKETKQDSVSQTEAEKKQISPPSSIDISTNLEITDKLKATIITDPYSDESLEIKGNGNLSFNITEGGNPRLVGTYNITSGKYKLKLYEVLRREFDIESGSKLTWSGDILDATADISASYRVNASSASLQNVLVSSGDNGSQASYSQIPVDVVLNLSGKLLTPDIDFDIKLDESYNESGVQAFVLNLNENESELNKQVFSLLLFNSFLNEGFGNKNPFAYELSNTAQKSLSSLLSASLNRFTSQYITGANISFDIKSYNKQQDILSPVTNFKMDFQKNLFNNRLSVQVGGNLVVDEEEMKSQTDIGNSLAGEFLLEYKITKNGALILQGYNKTEYGDIVDGELKKTGVALIFNKEFDTFRELFNRKNKKAKDEE